MNFYMKCRFVITRDYLGDSVICIVPYRRLYGSRILCVREVFIVCTLYYVGIVLRLGRFYYVIWTFHVLSLYIMFLSHLLFLCVAVYLLLERERLKYMSKTSYRQIVSRLPFAYTYTHPINTTNRRGRYMDQELSATLDGEGVIVGGYLN